MPEEATRKLLKLFGMALTDFEDQTTKTLERLKTEPPPDHSPAATLEVAEDWLKAQAEAMARWLEVTQVLVEIQAKAQAELVRLLGQARERPG
jgi:hypothetical protein